jgi:homoserine/homoserine lactone efflux protein
VDLSVWITYLIATFILSLSPGPGVFSSISSGLHHGFRLGLWNGVGMQAANMILVAIVSLGLGAILLASETLFGVVKWLGVAYLIYLGIVTWRAPARGFHEDADDHETTARGVFMRGFFVNITNPKGITSPRSCRSSSTWHARRCRSTWRSPRPRSPSIWL